MTNEPIEEQAYVMGVTVVDIGDIRVARGLTRRPVSSCRHRQLVYDNRERRIWCKDCETDVDPFDAFTSFTEQYDRAFKDLVKGRQELEEAERFQCRSIAAREIDKAWRRQKYVPACPTCNHGLFPEDFKNGASLLGRDYALKRRQQAKNSKT
ncbi:hypothetical protein OIV19_21655 [Brucella sp. HL-2]|nr:hypothetical protein [Brucella sp. HL-2]MCV9910204.1 hypothetical protein [Brucella sp. HL-2]